MGLEPQSHGSGIGSFYRYILVCNCPLIILMAESLDVAGWRFGSFKLCETGSVSGRNRSGYPRISMARDDRRILLSQLPNHRLTAAGRMILPGHWNYPRIAIYTALELSDCNPDNGGRTAYWFCELHFLTQFTVILIQKHTCIHYYTLKFLFGWVYYSAQWLSMHALEHLNTQDCIGSSYLRFWHWSSF